MEKDVIEWGTRDWYLMLYRSPPRNRRPETHTHTHTHTIPVNDFQFFRESLHLARLSFRLKISRPATLETLGTRMRIISRLLLGLLPPRHFVSFILLIFCCVRPHLASPSRVCNSAAAFRSPPASLSFINMMDDGVPRVCPDLSRPNPHTPCKEVNNDPTTGPTSWGGGARNPERGWIVHTW